MAVFLFQRVVTLIVSTSLIIFCKGAPLQSIAVTSVTRLGDLLNFGQLFKAFDNN